MAGRGCTNHPLNPAYRIGWNFETGKRLNACCLKNSDPITDPASITANIPNDDAITLEEGASPENESFIALSCPTAVVVAFIIEVWVCLV